MAVIYSKIKTVLIDRKTGFIPVFLCFFVINYINLTIIQQIRKNVPDRNNF